MVTVYSGNFEQIKNSSNKKTIDFLKPYINQKRLSEDEMIKLYGDYFKKYQFTDDAEIADFCLLPYSWNYYYSSGKQKEALDFCKVSHQYKKQILSVTTGDFGVSPLDKNAIILRQSGYQSKRLLHQHAMPAFITDPLQTFFSNEFNIRNKSPKAVVGFCGQAVSSWHTYASIFFYSMVKNLKYYWGLTYNEPQVLYPSTLRRNRILKSLMSSGVVETHFIIRNKYRAGAQTSEEQYKSTMEFFNNILNTDYTVCVRGGGNFSVRLYETLALGRIPVFVNTDCVLPYDHLINWKKHVVWVEENEISKIGEIVNDFHSSLHKDDFSQLQLDNRKLWVDYLSFKGFHHNLHHLLSL